ncbi:MAG: GNAT family N-acetyltransferase [Gammaproteobacteria bacterium]|nr:GNAT family N-acetyltransferase [Gammaproteobacteria bacterium]
MIDIKNKLDQPIGFPVENWQSCQWPPRSTIEGRSCRIEAYQPDQHNGDLFDAFVKDPDQANWTYLPYGPFDSFEAFDSWARANCQDDDPLFHAVIDLNTGRAAGLASYLRITPTAGVIEVGHIHFSPLLQRTRVATECMYLMMNRVLDELGYRRYEWKCDALNAASCRAALRLGFVYEGIFRQATMYKSRNRDTAWYAVIDKDWPRLKDAFEQWLDDANFDQQGGQKHSLNEFIKV